MGRTLLRRDGFGAPEAGFRHSAVGSGVSTVAAAGSGGRRLWWPMFHRYAIRVWRYGYADTAIRQIFKNNDTPIRQIYKYKLFFLFFSINI